MFKVAKSALNVDIGMIGAMEALIQMIQILKRSLSRLKLDFLIQLLAQASNAMLDFQIAPTKRLDGMIHVPA